MLKFASFGVYLAAIITPTVIHAAVDPASDLELPNLDIPEKELGDAQKYVIFHKLGITAEQAEADLSFCFKFLQLGVGRRAPGFIPWERRDPAAPLRYDGLNLGVVGLGIAALVAGPYERGIRQSRLYRCMVPRGYARYRTSEDVWKLLNDKKGEANIPLQAAIAAGPKPPTASIEP